jgi:hypothetical protein
MAYLTKETVVRKNQLSRNKILRVPKILKNEAGKANSIDDLFSVKQGSSLGFNTRFNKAKELAKAEATDAEWNQVSKIAEESSDLIVMTKTKKLGAYILAISMRTPAKFRGTFVSRMQNFCLDAVQDMLWANAIRQDCPENKKLRERYQTDAIIKLKMLGYIALLAENSGCILLRQYKQISILLGDAINLAAAWRKSDEEKWRNKEI